MFISVCRIMEDYMGQNIFIGVLCVIALSAGIWSWLLEKGYTFEKDKSKKLGETVDEKK